MIFSITSNPPSDLKVEVDNFFRSSSALHKDPESGTQGTILLGKVTKGTLQSGKEIQLIIGEKKIVDTVVRIEIEGCKRDSVSKGEIGICLKKTTVEQLAKDFGLQSM